MPELPKAYEPKNYEDAVYKRWEESGFFNPDNLSGEPYSIMMPPPNVTGILHLGHALENALMDTMARFQRMQGKKVLLIPGTDHAAVATQAKVESLLIKEGVKNPREELGREGLLKKVREYAEDSKSTILTQIKSLGTSCDWSRLAYTFDDARSRAVNEVFVKMHQDGLIYRGYRVVNWSVKGQSTCSDDELVHVERPAKLYYFKYTKDFPITIATTRPETKLGDTAVAVHPEDARYKDLIGKKFVIEIGGAKPQTIHIIADAGIDPNFGTGALGVTPAHSSIDFEMYLREKAAGNDIGLISVIGEDGRMTAAAGAGYEGLTVEDARAKFVHYLRDQNVLEREEDIVQNVGTSDRFKDVVEPLPKTQWFVDVNKEIPGKGKTLKDLMREAVGAGSGKVQITPDRFEKIYFNWISGLRDWCISRQIWWGHRIPVWYKRPTQPIELTFVTHGSTQDNIDNTYSGNFDIELSDQGRAESIRQGELLANQEFDVVFTSDLKRAVETSALTFKGRSVEFIRDARLREIDLGDSRDNNLEQHLTTPFSHGESCRDVELRLRKFLSEVIDTYPGKKIAIITHRAPQLALEVLVNKKSWQEALKTDWRNEKPKAWQAGWKYNLTELQYVDSSAPEGNGWQQDPDTLDTWFSSGLWTFSTLGWPLTTVGFVRHGEAENNVAEVVSDDASAYPLTDRGRHQIVELADEIKSAGYEVIIASPVLRTKQTAEILADKLGLPLYFDDRIREVGMGTLNNHSEEEFAAVHQNDWLVKTPYGMESYTSLRTRTHAALAEILEKYRGRRVLIVSHGDPLEVMKQFGTDIYSNHLGPIHARGTCEVRNFAADNHQGSDLDLFHPTNWIQMGHEILFFWMARMVLMSTYTLGEIPFKDVYIHGMVRDEHGQKFSKSAGNGIDPIEVIAQYGCDALRWSLMSGISPGNDMRFYKEKIEGARNLVNKLLNISRYVLTTTAAENSPQNVTLADRWILDRLNDTIKTVTENIEKYNFSYAGEVLRDFTWGDFADWYLESAKIEGGKDAILREVLTTILKLWHPYMPFVTEAIWSEINGPEKMLLVEKWPEFTTTAVGTGSAESTKSFELVKKIIVGIRVLRAEHRIEPAKLITVAIKTGETADWLEEVAAIIKGLGRIESLTIAADLPKPANAIGFVESGVEVFVDMAGLVDTDKEKTRLAKEIASVAPYVAALEKKLSNAEFVQNAPAAVIDVEKAKLADAKNKLEKLQVQLSSL